ncbi:GNAT family N-acetyltransferase [Wenxinia saemankumensis]|uniref:Acetyltransferase (GNAT) family protein n=1 Tax=Wenxinia saemankumensis TaxID=1447782 RepID=A0A1M6HG49_9RHOB|nr:GNAT family N-acetyltransferase [Wenxinia saemankumensis]SHJ21125.1 Acetyltransferase (GNAT) family protein [Wenxinia saemankumensis]
MSGESDRVRIRPLERGDRSEWGALWRAYLAFYGTTRPEDHVTAYFDRLLAEDPHDFRCRLALSGGRPVGLVHFLFHAHGWRAEPVCYLQDLYADVGVRGRGVGRALIEAVYAEADRRGAPSVYWLTQAGNAPARALYDRVGRATDFVKYERPS